MFVSRLRSADRGGKGFTLVELMVTVAVLAILATIGLPSFQRLVADYRVSSQANSIQGLVQFARAEAVKRRGNTVVCRDGDLLSVGLGNDCNTLADPLRLLPLDSRVGFDGFPEDGLGFSPSGYTLDRAETDVLVSHPLVAARRLRLIASGFSDITKL